MKYVAISWPGKCLSRGGDLDALETNPSLSNIGADGLLWCKTEGAEEVKIHKKSPRLTGESCSEGKSKVATIPPSITR